MRANQAEFPVATMCRTLDLSTSGYYAWVQREPSARDVANAALLERMREIHRFSRRSYGRPRMYAELRDEGRVVNHKRVGRLMNLEGLVGVTRRKKWRTTKRDRDARPAPDLVERDFQAEGPNELWVADIIYIPTWCGFLYLAVVVDAWSRRVVGWAMETHLKTDLVLQALNMAVAQRWPRNVIHHSDQGTQYTSIAFGLRCKHAAVRPSMRSVGDAYDNALCESSVPSGHRSSLRVALIAEGRSRLEPRTQLAPACRGRPIHAALRTLGRSSATSSCPTPRPDSTGLRGTHQLEDLQGQVARVLELLTEAQARDT